MSFARETYYGALWTQLETLAKTANPSGPFVTLGRRVRLLEDMEDGELPALFMGVASQEMARVTKSPPRHFLDALLFVYAANPDDTVAAAIALNGYIDVIEALLAAPPGFEEQTLGGAVEFCRLDGKLEIFDGPRGVRAAAILPVKMLV